MPIEAAEPPSYELFDASLNVAFGGEQSTRPAPVAEQMPPRLIQRLNPKPVSPETTGQKTSSSGILVDLGQQPQSSPTSTHPPVRPNDLLATRPSIKKATNDIKTPYTSSVPPKLYGSKSPVPPKGTGVGDSIDSGDGAGESLELAPEQSQSQPAEPSMEKPSIKKPAMKSGNIHTTKSGDQQERRTAQRRQQSIEAANALLASSSTVRVTCWQVNSAGALVAGEGITGFVPLSELSATHVQSVLVEERRLRSSRTEAGSPTDAVAGLRREAMAILRGQDMLVRVLAVDSESGRVVLSERPGFKNERPSDAALEAAKRAVGNVVAVTILSRHTFGVFVEFELETTLSSVERCLGLVHASEVSWEVERSDSRGVATPDVVPGTRTRASITHVDLQKGRIFLSMRRAVPNPLLETLDSLLATSKGQSLENTVPSDGDLSIDSSKASGRQTLDAASDMRPLLGDLDVAADFSKQLEEAEGVMSAVPGVRLQSRASSPAVEVYMGMEAPSSPDSEPSSHKLVVRRGRDVQEIRVVTMLGRQELRQLSQQIVAKMQD